MSAMDFLMDPTWVLPSGASRSLVPLASAKTCKMQLQFFAFLLCNFLYFYFTLNTSIIQDMAVYMNRNS